jgi:hypothetical protein
MIKDAAMPPRLTVKPSYLSFYQSFDGPASISSVATMLLDDITSVFDHKHTWVKVPSPKNWNAHWMSKNSPEAMSSWQLIPWAKVNHVKEPKDMLKLEHLWDALLKPWLVSSIAHIHELLPKSEGIVLSTMVHIILPDSSGVAAKLRTGSQPIPSKLTDKIGEQATPSNPSSMRKALPLITLLV